jgi:hypothetical protein
LSLISSLVLGSRVFGSVLFFSLSLSFFPLVFLAGLGITNPDRYRPVFIRFIDPLPAVAAMPPLAVAAMTPGPKKGGGLIAAGAIPRDPAFAPASLPTAPPPANDQLAQINSLLASAKARTQESQELYHMSSVLLATVERNTQRATTPPPSNDQLAQIKSLRALAAENTQQLGGLIAATEGNTQPLGDLVTVTRALSATVKSAATRTAQKVDFILQVLKDKKIIDPAAFTTGGEEIQGQPSDTRHFLNSVIANAYHHKRKRRIYSVAQL